MRFMTLPNNSIMMALITEEICMGDRHEEQVGSDRKELNPLQWKRIRLNLPVTKTYMTPHYHGYPRCEWTGG